MTTLVSEVGVREHLKKYLMEYRNLPGFQVLVRKYGYSNLDELFEECLGEASKREDTLQFSVTPWGYFTLSEWLRKARRIMDGTPRVGVLRR